MFELIIAALKFVNTEHEAIEDCSDHVQKEEDQD